MKNLLLVFFVLYSFSVFGQSTTDTISLSPVDYEEVRDDWVIEEVVITITGTGATATLSQVPYNELTVVANVNGAPISSLSGSGMSVVGQSVTFNNALLGYSITSSDRIFFQYFKK